MSNGRPRSGAVFDAYKHVERKFRKMSRRYMHGFIDRDTQKLNFLFRDRKMKSFWNELQKRNHKTPNSNLMAQDFVTFYQGIMQDTGSVIPAQTEVYEIVESTYMKNCVKVFDTMYSSDQVNTFIS